MGKALKRAFRPARVPRGRRLRVRSRWSATTSGDPAAAGRNYLLQCAMWALASLDGRVGESGPCAWSCPVDRSIPAGLETGE